MMEYKKKKTHLEYVHINKIIENKDENARIFGKKIKKKVSQIF